MEHLTGGYLINRALRGYCYIQCFREAMCRLHPERHQCKTALLAINKSVISIINLLKYLIYHDPGRRLKCCNLRVIVVTSMLLSAPHVFSQSSVVNVLKDQFDSYRNNNLQEK